MMDEVEVAGLRIAFEREGNGPPLLLLSGFVGDGRGTWGGQIDGLRDEFAVMAWDPPGVGRSSDPPAWFRLPDYADCLAQFVDALGLGRPHVVGRSFGGALALELYRRILRSPRRSSWPAPTQDGLARSRPPWPSNGWGNASPQPTCLRTSSWRR